MKSRSESLIRLKKFQVDEKRRSVTQIEMMIADFERMAAELDQQIEIEHQKTGISDVAHFAYSTFAKAASARRDNLLNSARDMRVTLETAQDALAEAVEDLKKVELLDQREHGREAEAGLGACPVCRHLRSMRERSFLPVRRDSDDRDAATEVRRGVARL